jgi:hypothetical protein
MRALTAGDLRGVWACSGRRNAEGALTTDERCSDGDSRGRRESLLHQRQHRRWCTRDHRSRCRGSLRAGTALWHRQLDFERAAPVQRDLRLRRRCAPRFHRLRGQRVELGHADPAVGQRVMSPRQPYQQRRVRRTGILHGGRQTRCPGWGKRQDRRRRAAGRSASQGRRRAQRATLRVEPHPGNRDRRGIHRSRDRAPGLHCEGRGPARSPGWRPPRQRGRRIGLPPPS